MNLSKYILFIFIIILIIVNPLLSNLTRMDGDAPKLIKEKLNPIELGLVGSSDDPNFVINGTSSNGTLSNGTSNGTLEIQKKKIPSHNLIISNSSTNGSTDSETTALNCKPRFKDCPCGVRNNLDPEPPIRLGKVFVSEAKPHEFPYRVHITVKYKDPFFNFGFFNTFCGGSILTPNYVLTAAHCCSNIIPVLSFDVLLSILNKAGGIPVFSILFPDGIPAFIPNLLTPADPVSAEWVIVTAGDHDLSKPDGEVDYQVAEVISHKGFRWRIMDDDMCLLRLKKPIVFDKMIGPICLPWDLTEEDMSKNGTVVTISGWGKRDEKDVQLPERLQKMDNLPLMKTEDCKKFYKEKFNSDIITDKMICTYVPGKYKGPCQRDSGGTIDLYSEGRAVYQGSVVSFGKHCDKDKDAAPAVYAKLISYKNWINQHTKCDEFCFPEHGEGRAETATNTSKSENTTETTTSKPNQNITEKKSR